MMTRLHTHKRTHGTHTHTVRLLCVCVCVCVRRMRVHRLSLFHIPYLSLSLYIYSGHVPCIDDFSVVLYFHWRYMEGFFGCSIGICRSHYASQLMFLVLLLVSLLLVVFPLLLLPPSSFLLPPSSFLLTAPPYNLSVPRTTDREEGRKRCTLDCCCCCCCFLSPSWTEQGGHLVAHRRFCTL